MDSSFQLPQTNALSTADRIVLQTIFASLVKEINRLRTQVERLQQGYTK